MTPPPVIKWLRRVLNVRAVSMGMPVASCERVLPTDTRGLKMAEAIGFLRRMLVVSTLALFTVSAWGEGLFIPLDAGAAAETSGGQRLLDGHEGDSWLVRVNQRLLFRTIHGVAAQGSGRLVLNVAQDLAFEVVVERTSPTLSGYSLSGRVAGVAGSAVTFAAGAEVLVGIVWTPGAVYELAPKKDGVHVFRQVALSARPRLAEPIRAEGGWNALVATDQATADGGAVDGGTVADVLALWTPKVRENTGGEAPTRAGIDLAVAWANDAFERSGAEVRLNLVGAEEVDYVESGNSATDLDRLEYPSDGFMDEVHERRDALGADLVSLFAGGGDAAGLASTPGSFSFVAMNLQWSVYWSAGLFAHELGHNMGLSHDRYVVMSTGLDGLFPFSYGYVNNLAFEPSATRRDCFITIMAYGRRCVDAGLPVIAPPYFSTPDLRYPDGEGAPLGVPKSSDEEWADGPADAVRALNLNLPRIVNYHRGRIDDGDTADTATPVPATSNTLATLANRHDVDYFRIELPESGSLRAESTGGGHLRGALVAEDGRLIAEDNRWEPQDILIEAELEAGVYFIKVEAHRGWDWSPDGSAFGYALAVSFKPQSAADDHGDTAANATVASLRSSTAGELQSPSDTDFFRFEVAERSLVRVGTSGNTDVVGRLTSEDGAIILTNDDGGPALNFLIAAKLDPGVYFVSVRGFGGNEARATGAYSLDISFSAPFDDHADFPFDATDVAIGATIGGELEVMLDEDHFRIEVHGLGPGQLWAESKGSARVGMALLRQDGEPIAEERESPSIKIAVGAQVAPGTYFLRVAGRSASNVGRYDVKVWFIADSRAIPLFLSASHPDRRSFARIINRDNRPGMVTIHAIDDAGLRRGSAVLSLAARQTAHFNSAELENGSVAKGLSGGVGAGEGDWRLELDTDLDIEALAYVRTEQGFLASLHDAATSKQHDSDRREILATFSPASSRQVGRLRLVYAGPSTTGVFLRGRDDRNQMRRQSFFFWLDAGASRSVTAQELEGSFGDGVGMWRLYGAIRPPVRAMSLLESPAGKPFQPDRPGGNRRRERLAAAVHLGIERRMEGFRPHHQPRQSGGHGDHPRHRRRGHAPRPGDAAARSGRGEAFRLRRLGSWQSGGGAVRRRGRGNRRLAAGTCRGREHRSARLCAHDRWVPNGHERLGTGRRRWTPRGGVLQSSPQRTAGQQTPALQSYRGASTDHHQWPRRPR